jgi:hypothetical protein
MNNSDSYKIQYSDINEIKKRCKNIIIYFSRIKYFLDHFLKDIKENIIFLKNNKNCFNSNEKVLKQIKESINQIISDINTNNTLSSNLFDYKFTKNIISNNDNISEYFINNNSNEIHTYKNKYFIEFIFDKDLIYLFSLPIFTINYDDKNLILTIKIFRKFLNFNSETYFKITNLYDIDNDIDYIDKYNYNMNYLDTIINNPDNKNLNNYLDELLNEFEAIYKITDIIT